MKMLYVIHKLSRFELYGEPTPMRLNINGKAIDGVMRIGKYIDPFLFGNNENGPLINGYFAVFYEAGGKGAHLPSPPFRGNEGMN